MSKNKYKNTTSKHITRAQRLIGLFAVAGLLVSGTIVRVPFTSAQSLQEQINELSQENSNKKDQQNYLQNEAVSLEDNVNKLEQRIAALQQQIAENEREIARLEGEIQKAEEELAKQKDLLGKNIRAMYVEGDISTIEMLASSKDLSEFVDKQQYRNSVKNKITTTLAKINELKHQLRGQRETMQLRVEDQKRNQAQIDTERREQNRLLGLNQNQRAELDGQIRDNNKRIEELKRQQAAENARLFGGSGGILGGGGYPWGHAVCLHTGEVDGPCWNYDWAVGGSIWNWQTGGYGYRNCTDWVAYRVATTGRYVPSGLGNAKDWATRAQSRGFAVDQNPRAGDAAVSTAGFYGHVMYVEAVNGDGTIVVSDYNRAGTGKYDSSTISASGLWFVHF